MTKLPAKALVAAVLLLSPVMALPAFAQTQREPYGIGLEGFAYPWPRQHAAAGH